MIDTSRLLKHSMPEKQRAKYTSFIGLGSNVGDRKENLVQAKNRIRKDVGEILLESSYYKTEPWGYSDQEFFINQVISLETALSPWSLLKILQKIEHELLREKKIHWGPRSIDLDILYYDKKIIYENNLIIPHPYLYLRNFVLAPLVEIAPDFKHALLKKTNRELLEICDDKNEALPLVEEEKGRKQ